MDQGHWQKIEEIFHQVLDQPAGEQDSYLRQLCAENESLYKDVRTLLDSLHRSDEVIPTHLLEDAAKILNDHSSEPDLSSGKRIGPYRVIRLLDYGGMGAVYLAERADEQYAKQVAIKLVRPDLAAEQLLERFRRERQILANLEHPNIARLLDGGTTEDGTPFLVMEYVNGSPIDEFCDKQGLLPANRLKLFQTVCSAVQFAHRNLVVHRDIKPANVLVTPEGIPKLMDFGIAKILSPEPAADVTATALPMMTMGYASPEQIHGETITTSSDIYSLGVLLYVLLTGSHPYLKEGTPTKVLDAIRNSEPQRPSVVARQTAKPQLDEDLDNIVLTALRKEPERRYATVEQFSEDIRRYLEGLPVLARPANVRYRARKFLKRHKWGFAAVSLILISLLGGIIATAWQAQKARLEEAKAKQVTHFLQSMLSSANPREKGKDVTVAELLAEASRRVDTELKNQPDVEAAVRTTIGTTYTSLGLFDQAESHLEKALQIRRQLYGKNNIAVAESLQNLANLFYLKGEYDRAEPLYVEALPLAKDDNLESTILFGFGELKWAKGELDLAEKMHRQNLEMLRKENPEDHEDVAKTLNGLAVVVGTKGDYAGAERLHREALQIILRLKGAKHPDTALAYNTLAGALDYQKKYDEAAEFYERALSLRRELLGKEHPDVAWTLYNYAYMLLVKGDYSRAEQLSREMLLLRGKTLPDSHPMIASSMQVLGRSLMHQSDAVAAEPLLRESLTLRKTHLPAEHWLIAASESVLGECLTILSKYSEAETLLTTSYKKLKEKLGENHERTVETAERLRKLTSARNQKL